MTFRSKILITITAVIALDAVQFLLSRILLFDFVNLWWTSFVIYFAAGYWGTYRRSFKSGMLLAAVAGVTDGTIGWLVLIVIQPFTKIGVPPLNLLMLVIADVLIMARALLLGLIGASLCALTGQARPG